MTVRIFVPDIPEFTPLLDAARKADGCHINPATAGYWTINAQKRLRFERRAVGLNAALWNSALCGGFQGTIEQYDRDVMSITSDG